MHDREYVDLQNKLRALKRTISINHEEIMANLAQLNAAIARVGNDWPQVSAALRAETDALTKANADDDSDGVNTAAANINAIADQMDQMLASLPGGPQPQPQPAANTTASGSGVDAATGNATGNGAASANDGSGITTDSGQIGNNGDAGVGSGTGTGVTGLTGAGTAGNEPEGQST